VNSRISRLAGRTLSCTLLLAATPWISTAVGQAPPIPRYPLAPPLPTCHPDPCASQGEPMLSYARSTGGVNGRTGEYSVSCFRLVLSDTAYIMGFTGAGSDGNEPPDLFGDFTPYCNVFSSLDAFAANPMRGDVYFNIPLFVHHAEAYGDDPKERWLHTMPFTPFFLDVGTYYIAIQIDKEAETWWYNQSPVDLGTDYFATSDAPGEVFAWESQKGYDTGTIAIDVRGVLGVIPCPADVNVSGEVEFYDIIEILDQWGECPDHCPADIDNSGDVGLTDVLMVLDEWGPCDK
jgi:hypothetical protein